MAVDQSEAFRSEDEAPEGPLDYGQNYPTMLPFLPPDQEAALQVWILAGTCCCTLAQGGRPCKLGGVALCSLWAEVRTCGTR